MKKKIALLAGGYSGEYVISIQTAITIDKNLDKKLYDVYKIIVTREGWYHETDNGKKIAVDKNDFSLTIDSNKIKFDAVFIAIHGTPGEDGKIQGYLDMLEIPYTSCNVLVSALTFSKTYCNKVVRAFAGVNVARSVTVMKGDSYVSEDIIKQLELPVFVKPSESGSSLGVSKVKTIEEMAPAIEKAFKEDNQVLIEEFIDGRELSIGVYQVKGQLHTLPPTELVTENEFFDYEAKYTPGVTKEITPAPIGDDVTARLKEMAAAIYANLGCRGVVRIDFILQKNTDKLYFLEVNTMPGQSENSIVPQQVRAAGMTLEAFYRDIVEDCLDTKTS